MSLWVDVLQMLVVTSVMILAVFGIFAASALIGWLLILLIIIYWLVFLYRIYVQRKCWKWMR